MNEMISIWSSSFPSNVLRVWDISERECGNECFFDAQNNRTNTWQKEEGWYSECAVVFSLPLDFKMSNKVSRWRDNVNWKCCWMNGRKKRKPEMVKQCCYCYHIKMLSEYYDCWRSQRTKHFSAHDTVREILALSLSE